MNPAIYLRLLDPRLQVVCTQVSAHQFIKWNSCAPPPEPSGRRGSNANLNKRLLLLGLVVQDALHNLLLLDQERPDHALAHAVPTPGATIGARYVLLALARDRGASLRGAQRLDATELLAAIAALGHGGLLGHIQDVEPEKHTDDIRVRTAGTTRAGKPRFQNTRLLGQDSPRVRKKATRAPLSPLYPTCPRASKL